MKIVFKPLIPEAKINPPEPVKFNMPDWYKNMSIYMDGANSDPEYYYNNPNMMVPSFTLKKCVPIMDYLTSGYMIKFCNQIQIKPSVIGSISAHITLCPEATKDTKVGPEPLGFHPHAQCPILIGGKRRHYIKFTGNWLIQTPPGYSCFFYQPFFNLESRFTLFPAIVDTDMFDYPINFPGYVTGDDVFTIEPGDNMIAVFPFKRDEWKMEIQDKIPMATDTNFFIKRRQYISDAYRKFFHSKKKYN